MSTVALARASLRNYSGLLAPWLAVALAVTIPLSNSLTTVLSILLTLACLSHMDRATWSEVLKNPITLPILVLVGLSLVDISYSIASNKEVTLAIRKISRL